MDGYIKLHRKIFDNKYYFKEKFTYSQAWIDLILLAKDKDEFIIKRGIRVMVKRGQIGEGIDILAIRWKWSRSKAERFINGLESEQKLIRQNNNITTIISIIKYDLYQLGDRANGKANDKADFETNSKAKNIQKTRPSSYTLSNQLLFEDSEPIKTVEQAVIWPTFEDFWHEYDKKVGRPKAEPKWNRLTQVEKEHIMAYIPKYKLAQPDKQYRKGPESFLNNKTWNDEIITTNGTDNKRQKALEDFLKPF